MQNRRGKQGFGKFRADTQSNPIVHRSPQPRPPGSRPGARGSGVSGPGGARAPPHRVPVRGGHSGTPSRSLGAG
jgi:hypothetical protein